MPKAVPIDACQAVVHFSILSSKFPGPSDRCQNGQQEAHPSLGHAPGSHPNTTPQGGHRPPKTGFGVRTSPSFLQPRPGPARPRPPRRLPVWLLHATAPPQTPQRPGVSHDMRGGSRGPLQSASDSHPPAPFPPVDGIHSSAGPPERKGSLRGLPSWFLETDTSSF